MKHPILRVMTLTSMLLMAATANAGKPSSNASPTLTTSCPCHVGTGVEFFGSGFKAGTKVELNITGGASYTITTIVDGGGNIDVNYGTILPFPASDYTVSAYTASGKRQFITSTSFEVGD